MMFLKYKQKINDRHLVRLCVWRHLSFRDDGEREEGLYVLALKLYRVQKYGRRVSGSKGKRGWRNDEKEK
jgi:hypothetical protein